MSKGAAYVDVSLFPEVPEEARPRSVYFKLLSVLDRAALKNLGYQAVCLLELPRGTPEQEISYLMAKLQGIEEGTIATAGSELDALELEMKAYNLLAQKHVVMRFDLGAKQKGKSLGEVLSSWKNSRHTLRGNSTIEGMQLPDLRRKELTVDQGKRGKGDSARAKHRRKAK